MSDKESVPTLEPCPCVCHRLITGCPRCGGQPCRSNVSSNAVAQTVDAMWDALKAVCCKFPTEAKLAVFVSEKKFKEALTPFAATTPAPQLHWPFAAKHPNCDECAKEYEAPPAPVEQEETKK